MNTGVKILLSIVLFVVVSVILAGIREAGGAGFIGYLIFFGAVFFGYKILWKK